MTNKNTYYINTLAIFKGCKIPKRQPDYISKYGRNRRADKLLTWLKIAGIVLGVLIVSIIVIKII